MHNAKQSGSKLGVEPALLSPSHLSRPTIVASQIAMAPKAAGGRSSGGGGKGGAGRCRSAAAAAMRRPAAATDDSAAAAAAWPGPALVALGAPAEFDTEESLMLCINNDKGMPLTFFTKARRENPDLFRMAIAVLPPDDRDAVMDFSE